MPRKLRRPKLRTGAGNQLRRDDLTVDEEFSFVLSWSPPAPGTEPPGVIRWRTWAEYLSAFEDVRDEMAESYPDSRQSPLFAERVRQFRIDHGAEALANATHRDLSAYGAAEARQ